MEGENSSKPSGLRFSWILISQEDNFVMFPRTWTLTRPLNLSLLICKRFEAKTKAKTLQNTSQHQGHSQAGLLLSISCLCRDSAPWSRPAPSAWAWRLGGGPGIWSLITGDSAKWHWALYVISYLQWSKAEPCKHQYAFYAKAEEICFIITLKCFGGGILKACRGLALPVEATKWIGWENHIY